MNSPIQVKTQWKRLLADTITPVSIYLRIRDVFPNSILLESADYHNRNASMSYICCDPVSTIILQNGIIREKYPDGSLLQYSLEENSLTEKLKEYSRFFIEDPSLDFPFPTGGLFGYLSYDAVQYFENIHLNQELDPARKVPEMVYSVYKYVIAIQHFNNEMVVFEHDFQNQEDREHIGLEELVNLIQNKNFSFFPFHLKGKEESNFTDEEFLEGIAKVKSHVHRGDIFQMQLSRRFSQGFSGDDFNVYRSLRSINPSPYLFYFDFGNFKIFGSSPETQILVEGGKAKIHPIAGTFRRTGNPAEDLLIAEKLKADPKENSEHVMLVDLARNDLSRHCTEVGVDIYRDVEFYSHVIHLVSRVSGKLRDRDQALNIVADTFPAGTLTGAPKYRAMELIDQYEKGARGIYGGAIGILNFNGDFNHAILIRSFLSKHNVLYYQAAGGIVADSVHQNELEEVGNKLRALKKALLLAESLVL